MTPYPPGTSAGDPNAPWNEEPATECHECEGVYTDDGHNDSYICLVCDFEKFTQEEIRECPDCGEVEEFDHNTCPNEGMNAADYEEGQRMAKGDRQYDEMRERQYFDK